MACRAKAILTVAMASLIACDGLVIVSLLRSIAPAPAAWPFAGLPFAVRQSEYAITAMTGMDHRGTVFLQVDVGVARIQAKLVQHVRSLGMRPY